MSDTTTDRVLVTTPTGNVGRRVAQRLVEQRVPISVLVRSGGAGRLAPEVAAAATVYEGALSDPEAFTEAAQGSSALFFALPPDPTAESLEELWGAFTRAAVAAVEASGIERVVLLSTQGAARDAGALKGPLYDAERALEAAAPHVRSLRAGGFMENLLALAPAIASGTLPFPAPLDLPIALVSTTDIGDLAAQLLQDTSWTGHRSVGVYGPGETSLRRLAERLSERGGQLVEPVTLTADDVYDDMIAAGLTPGMARPTADMFRDIDATFDDLDPAEPGYTPSVGIDAFIDDTLLPAVRASRTAA